MCIPSIRPDPTNRFAIAADLGADKLVICEMDLEHGRLNKHAEVKVQPGAGPRHSIFQPNGQYLYLINELNSTLIVYRYQPDVGSLKEVQTISTLPQDYQGQNLCADLHICGNYLYTYAFPDGDANGASTPVEITPQIGDRFTDYVQYYTFDSNHNATYSSELSDDVFTWGEKGFSFYSSYPVDGQYAVGIVAYDFDNNQVANFEFINYKR